MTVMVGTTNLVAVTCWCGIVHAIPDSLHRIAQKDHKHAVYCPLGHEWVVSGPTEAERLRERLANEQERRAATTALLRHEERSHAATRGHMTRIKKRIAHGVCPCCNRSFADVERHMASQHPDYVTAAATA